MALPGLHVVTASVNEEVLPAIVELPKNSEWRFEVAFGDKVVVKLLSGLAELYGTELSLNQPYSFTGYKGAIYTWHGCRLEVTGQCQVDYTAEETPMSAYMNTHFALEDSRILSSDQDSLGPRVLVIGPENAGKSTLVKILASYANRTGQQPVLINTDCKEGMFSIPGTLSATVLDSIIDVEQGWGSSPTNGPSQIPVKLPLVYHYGTEDPESNGDYFKALLSRLALSVMSRITDDPTTKYAGCIIDTSGSISQGKMGYDVIQHIVAEFSVNVLIVLGSERLFSDMSRRFAKQPLSGIESVAVLKLEKSGGCVDRDKKYLQQMRQAQIREYFFGTTANALSPHTQVVDFGEATIYRIKDSSDMLDSFLPGGEAEDASLNSLFEVVQPSMLLHNCILAIVQADPSDTQEQIRDASVIGFVYVAEVDEKKRKLRVLAPLSGRLPRKAMIWGTWPEIVSNLVG